MGDKKFHLQTSLLPFCEGSWDEDKQNFTNDNSMDVINCCLNKCKNRIGFCFEKCHEYHGPKGKKPNYNAHIKCHKQCNDLIAVCETACLEYPSEGISFLSKCASEQNCGTYPLFDRKCLEVNKENILDCCKTDCIPTNTIDCTGQCNDFYNHLARGSESPLTDIAKHYIAERDKFTNKNDNNYAVMISIIVAVILAVLGSYIIYKMIFELS